MSAPRSSSRGPPSRPHSTHSQKSDTYIPPSGHPQDSDYDFCNSFWVTPQRSRRDGRDAESEERDWGKEGYECLMTRVKSGSKVLDDLRGVLKERASIEEDYAKRLQKLSKSSFGTGETGHMERAMLTLKGELEQTSKSHHDLASLLRQQDSMVSDFTQKREGARKTQQSGIEKTWKSMNNQREHVLKAKTKYENDAIQINSLHAQASLLQGRDLDKATLKMDKVQQTVVVNERDYKNFVNVLKETTVNWNMAWKTFCDLVQDQEEERLEFVKGRMWDWANAQSTIAMAEDESAERTRTALEQCEPKLDIRIFVQRFATGNCIPDPLPFVDAARTTPHPKQSYKTAKFSRSSTRIPGVKHSPSAVNDIARALHQQTSSTPLSVAPQTNSARPPPPSSTSTSAIPQQQQQHSRGASSTSIGANGISRPASRGANLYAESTSQTFSPSQETTPTRPVLNNSAPSSTSRFAVSPSAASLRQPPPSSDPRAVSPTPAKPGHINAAAFQNRPSAVVPTQPQPVQSVPSPAQYQASPASSPKKPSSFPSPYAHQPQTGGGGGDDENDPLLQALKVLQSTPAPAASPRSSRMSPHPQSTSSQSSSTPAPARPLSAMGQRPNHRSQSSLGQNLPPAVGMGGRSRPTSPAPQAAMMQPPSSSSVSNQTQASYGQAFPGERAQQQQQQQQIARPHSRAGSNVSQQAPQPNRNSLASPPSVGNFQARPSSPGFAGVGATATANRGRSPSPQPYIPESLRPRSPAIQQQIHAQQQQRPTSAYGNHSQPPSNQYSNPPNPYGGGGGGVPPGYPTAVQSQSQQHPYAQPPPAQPNPYARATSPAPPQQAGRPNSMVSYAPAPPQSHPYSSQQFPSSPSSHLTQQQQQPLSSYSAAPTPSPQPYPYPSQTHYSAPPPQTQQFAPPPASSVISQSSIQRTPSLHSGVSSVPPSHQPYSQPQQQHARAPSVASVRAAPAPPPTGQYTDQGVPIIFYVNALFDYRATSGEEFSFSQGDVIAVTATDPDGWWQGQRVGDSGNSKLFPSNFTELLS